MISAIGERQSGFIDDRWNMSIRLRTIIILSVVAAALFLFLAAIKYKTTKAQPGMGNRSQRPSGTTPFPADQTPEPTTKNTNQHLTASPTGQHFVYHSYFDPYKSSPESPMFTIVERKTGKKTQIPIHWSARYVASVNWLDDRFVLVHGEGAFFAILDVIRGQQTHDLVGAGFSISPDEAKLVYHYNFNPLRGYVPPERQSDNVLLALVQRPAGSQSPGNNYKVVYPTMLNWGEPAQKNYSDLEDRHQLRGSLAWSPDSSMIAFVEFNRRKLWLVVLELQTSNEDVSVGAKRFDLGVVSREGETKISWSPTLTKIQVGTDDANWLVDLRSGTVTRK